ncbi:MAG TPA: DUF6754 domain-containing protein [candidate division Zixibacteria bacterium]|nr:DUF6754 domain-containing protein [candidate division Zixibacteria bacterium]
MGRLFDSRFILSCTATACGFLSLATDARAAGSGFQSSRTPEAFAIGLAALSVILSLWWIRSHGLPRLRRLPPMEAINDAIGRATEKGTPTVYITGWGGDMARPTTMASMEILSTVARRSAEYNCRLIFPSHDPVVTSVAEDTIHQAATVAGRPDWASTADVTFVTQSQFGYSAAVDGLMAREHPGAVFLLGTFEGEALLLAEGAYQSGAVTIAGTDSTIQLSFFLVACDYTLIGEELFAASGIVSGDPVATAGVLGQDWLKYLILGVLVIGLALAVLTDIDPAAWLSP